MGRLGEKAGRIVALPIVIGVVLLEGCDRIPRKATMDDPQVQQLVKAAEAFDRTSYGFTAIPAQADVRLEMRSAGQYDAMLHIAAKTSRTIAFRKKNGNYVWIGDQESFQGPKKYKTEDGTFNEHIVLTYETQRVSGFPLSQLNVQYWGEDPRLAGPAIVNDDLTLALVTPILKEWGY